MERLAYSVGFFLGDGNLQAMPDGQKRVRFWKPDKEPLDRIADEVFMVFGRRYAVVQDNSKHVNGDYWRLQLTQPLIHDFFQSNTLSRTEVPVDFFHSAPSVKLAVLAGLVDSDGFISIASRGGDRSDEYRMQMGFSNTNRRLVEQFAELGDSVGIKILPVRESPPRMSGWRTMYGVTINLKSAWAAGLKLTSRRKNDKFAQAVAMLSASETMHTPAPTLS